MGYVIICVLSGIGGGIIGKLKGSSFILWFLISLCVPFIGPLTALCYRRESDELRRECPNCHKITKIYDALCTRCGHEFEFPEVALVSESMERYGRPQEMVSP